MKTKVILSQQMASAIIAAGQEEAQKNNWSVSIAVADDGGHLLALSRMDDCAPIAAQIHCTILQFIQKSHIKNLLTVRLVGLLALFYPVLPRCARGRAGILANFNRSYSGA